MLESRQTNKHTRGGENVTAAITADEMTAMQCSVATISPMRKDLGQMLPVFFAVANATCCLIRDQCIKKRHCYIMAIAAFKGLTTENTEGGPQRCVH